MKPDPTTVTGPLGSTVHVLRADPETIAALAAIDWSRRFRRVCLDPVRGLVTLMSPSRRHEELATIFGDIVDVAAEVLAGAGRSIGSTRIRGRGDPPDTGMEPDCAFYVGERARAYSRALREGEAAADTFLEQTPPDLVVGSRDHQRRRRQGRALRGPGGPGDVAAARTQGLTRIRSRIPHPASGRAASTAGRLRGSGRARARRRAGGDGRRPARYHQERTHRGGRPRRASATAAHHAHPGRGAALAGRTGPARDGRTRRVRLRREAFAAHASPGTGIS